MNTKEPKVIGKINLDQTREFNDKVYWFVASDQADKVTVNMAFLKRLTDNLKSASIEDIVLQFKKQLRTDNGSITSSEDFISLLENELIFHKTIKAIESHDPRDKQVDAIQNSLSNQNRIKKDEDIF